MDAESPELIEQKMQETRASLADKVVALEQQVAGTIQGATDAVQSVKVAVEDTMSTVKGTVTESVATIKEQVAEAFDLSAHTRSHPWGMVGGAAAVGFVAGLALFRSGRAGHASTGFYTYDTADRSGNLGAPLPAVSVPQAAGLSGAPGVSAVTHHPAPAAAPAAPRQPGWFDKVVDRLMEKASAELSRLGEAALASASASLNQAVQDGIPKLVGAVEQEAAERVQRFAANVGTGPAARPATDPYPGTRRM